MQLNVKSAEVDYVISVASTRNSDTFIDSSVHWLTSASCIINIDHFIHSASPASARDILASYALRTLRWAHWNWSERCDTDNMNTPDAAYDGGTVSSDDAEVAHGQHDENLDGSVSMSDSDFRSTQRLLYISHFLSTWNARMFEFAAFLFLAAIYPNSLLPASLYALLRALSAVVFANLIGQIVDNCDRLIIVRASIGKPGE